MSKKIYIFLNFILISFILTCCSTNFTNNSNDSNSNKIIISSLSKDKKGFITSIDPNTKKEKVNIKNKNVAITGDISSDSSKIAYIDALDDTSPWQLFVSNLNGNNSKQLTTTEKGKVNARFSKDGYIYYLSQDSEDTIKLFKYNLEKKEESIIDKENTDREVECFSISDNVIIQSTVSSSEKLKAWEESEDGNPLLSHTIILVNSEDSQEELTNITASTISSIDITKDGSKALIFGENINSDTGFGIYELTLKDKTLKKLILDSEVINKSDSLIESFINPYIVRYSEDENIIYFTASKKNAESFNLDEIECKAASLFTYNIENGKIEEFYTPKNPSLIFDLNVH